MSKKSLDAQALDVIAGIMADPEASVSERLKAAAIVLEHGKPDAPAIPKWARLDDLRAQLQEAMNHD